jgi:hypothetical protein
VLSILSQFLTLKEHKIMAKIQKLTVEQEARLVEFREEWRSIGLCCEPVEPEKGRYITGHSETGHFHTMPPRTTLGKALGTAFERKQVFRDPNPPAGMTILYAILQDPSCLDHERPFDTGIVRFTTSREFDHYAALARKAAD